METFYVADRPDGLKNDEIKEAVVLSLNHYAPPAKVLLIPPDFTRFHSNAGYITNIYYNALSAMGAEVDILPAVGTHMPLTEAEAAKMYGDIPFARFIAHDWRTDVVKLGEVPAAYLTEITGGLWNDPIDVEVNRQVMDPSYDLIISVGQVVPHEVVGMANHAKNLFVGVGGADMINKSHMVSAVCGMESAMGRDHAPARKIFDYALEHFLQERPLLFVLTVTTAPGGHIQTHGLFLGDTRKVLEEAIALAQKKNIDLVEKRLQKCVVYLDPTEFRTTWLGNKAIYRTCMAMADGGELLVLAPGVERFGEDMAVDALIRKYGYTGRENLLAQFRKPENQDLRDNMGAAAHLIHGCTNGRFRVTYAVKKIAQQEIAAVGFTPADYDETARRYDPEKLQYGFNTLPDGEEIFFVPNPALGLWAAELPEN